MPDEIPTTEDSAGPDETLVGTHQTADMEMAECLSAIEDMSKIPLPGSSWGDDTRAAAAVCMMRHEDGPDEVVARSSWIHELDWSPQPKNGQPRR